MSEQVYNNRVLDYIDVNADLLDENNKWEIVYKALTDSIKDHNTTLPRNLPIQVYLFLVEELGFDDVCEILDVEIDPDKYSKFTGLNPKVFTPPENLGKFYAETVGQGSKDMLQYLLVAYYSVKTPVDPNGLILERFFYGGWGDAMSLSDDSQLSVIDQARKQLGV